MSGLEAASVRDVLRAPWVPVLAAIAAVALFVSAGNWQGRRMAEKERLRTQLDAAARVAPVPLPSLATAAKLAQALEVTLTELISQCERPTSMPVKARRF